MALMERENRIATRGRSMSRYSRRFSFNGPSWDNEIHERPGLVPAVPRLSSHHQLRFSGPQRPVGSRRWDGNNRVTTDWDSLRRDSELWFGDGDCLVHLYSPGRSRRGPSFCLPLAEIEARNCGLSLEIRSTPPSPQSSHHSHSSSDSSIGSFSSYEPTDGLRHIYLPAPAELSKDEAFAYNVTTRNFFAWMFGRPIVGSHLGQALISLLERMNVYRADQNRNEEDVLTYMDGQGYTDFRECADHALAVLQFAEHFQIDELWADAFAHCTGMSVCLPASGEFQHISHISKTLMNRAYLEMDLRLERAGHSLSNFFEDDLSGAYLGLGNAARSHLDRFRSFLHAYYVGSYGYWPPARSLITNSAFPKALYLSMYFEFRDLYLFLVDTDSSTSIQENKIASGGLCVLQNVKAFDRRHRYKSLPHPLPITPESPRETKSHSFGSSAARRLGIGTRQFEFNRRVAVVQSLANATNKKIEIMTCPLVREYMLFERNCTLEDDEKISATDGRKVRWMLIYAIFQTLISVTQAPREVKDTQDVSYSLCCQIPTTPPWKIGVFNLQDHQTESPSSTKIDIQPDINYAASMSSASLVSTKSVKAIHTKRTSSPPSMRRMLTRAKASVIQTPAPKRPPFCEILVHGYGNGLNPASTHATEEYTNIMGDPKGVFDESAPSTPASSQDSSRWSNANLSSDESVSDMDHLSLDASTPSSRQNSSKSVRSTKVEGAGVPPPLEVLKVAE